jgi:dienelactone hydrolase
VANWSERNDTMRRGLSLLATVLLGAQLVACGESAASASEHVSEGHRAGRTVPSAPTVPSAQPPAIAEAPVPPPGAAGSPEAAAPFSPAPPPEPAALVHPGRWTRATQFPGSLRADERAPWRRHAPEVSSIEITSTLDGAREPALFYDSGSEHAKPLLVVLHSWSSTYLQNIHIPYAQFAVENDWVFLHPNFRGPNRRAQATLSELAVQDVLDAVDHAVAHANVDPSRIYLLGYSSGAMMALVLAGRQPQRWAGVAAWVAVYDLVDWYDETRRKGSRYARDIVIACGGAPRPGSDAEEECRRRSPAGWLHRAAGEAPVLIAHGVGDRLASVEHALRAYNALAAPEERFPDEHVRQIAARRRVPDALREALHEGEDERHFGPAGTPVVLHRTSRNATLVLFRGAHDMFYRPGLTWLSEQRRE